MRPHDEPHDPSFKHGKNLKIGNFCVIEENVVVGDDVTIGNYVLLKPGTRVGDGVFLDSYVRSSGNNHIQSGVTVRYGTTIAKGVTIEEGAFLSPNVMTIYSTHEGEGIVGTCPSSGMSRRGCSTKLQRGVSATR